MGCFLGEPRRAKVQWPLMKEKHPTSVEVPQIIWFLPMCGLVVHNLLLQQGRLQGVVERIQVRAAIFCTLIVWVTGVGLPGQW